MSSFPSEKLEWLEADGLGGFASGSAAGIRTRRYHALLLSAATPPTGRQALVSGMDVSVETSGSTVALSSQRYAPDVLHPDGASRIESFVHEPWPSWRYRVSDDLAIDQAIFVPKGHPLTVLRWRAVGGSGPARLTVRLFMSGRDYHSLHHENGAFRFQAEIDGAVVRWRPYDGVQAIAAASNGVYRPHPDWYRSFLYAEEIARGLDAIEDLATPGVFEWDLRQSDAVLILGAEGPGPSALLASAPALSLADRLEAEERKRRTALGGRLDRAADTYLVRRGSGTTIVAGYPWFTDWGRDTFIAMRGLCLSTARFSEARGILLSWAGTVSEGMLPNRFPDAGDAPEFNAVDASLWFIVAAHEWMTADASATDQDRARVRAAIDAILEGYARGTRFGIHADEDGLLAAGTPGAQLTWMDARIGTRVVTPRIGKPVEIQALWINALWIGAHASPRWTDLFTRAFASFEARFWNPAAEALYDVVDVDHQRGTSDPSFRPNQILAVGGLPLPLVKGARARLIVDHVERRLWTPIGLRSLAPGESAYVGRYAGGVEARDGAYHQGTAWPWLLGPFVEAWVRTRGGSDAARREARSRFLDPLLTYLDASGLDHLPEVANGDAPHTPGGCPFQAWSVGEALRLDRTVLRVADAMPHDTAPRRRHRSRAVRVE